MSVVFDLLEHVRLSLVGDRNSGWALLPWFPINLYRHMLLDHYLHGTWREGGEINCIHV